MERNRTENLVSVPFLGIVWPLFSGLPRILACPLGAGEPGSRQARKTVKLGTWGFGKRAGLENGKAGKRADKMGGRKAVIFICIHVSF